MCSNQVYTPHTLPQYVKSRYIEWRLLFLPFAAVVDIVREILELSRCRLGQGRKVLLQRMEQPWRWRTWTADCQSEYRSFFLEPLVEPNTKGNIKMALVVSVQDLHRTGCSLFCGIDAEANQLMLKRVLLGYARWNKTIGNCHPFFTYIFLMFIIPFTFFPISFRLLSGLQHACSKFCCTLVYQITDWYKQFIFL